MKKYSLLFVIFAGISWGSAGLFIHCLSLYNFSSFELALTRVGISSIVSIVLVLFTGLKRLKVTKKQIFPLILSGVSFFSMAAFYYMGINNSSVSTASVILNMAPIIVMIFSTVFWGEKFTLIKGIGVSVAVMGCALVTGIIGEMVFAPIGIMYSFLSCLSYATYSISVRIASRSGVETHTLSTYTFVIATLIAVFFANPTELVSKALSLPFYIILAWIGFGFVTGFLASFLYSKGMRYLPAGVVAAMSSIEPLTLTLTGIFFLHETVTVYSAIGMVMILSAVFILGISNKD